MASTIMSTGQITIVDLTDQRASSFYLQANQSKIQTHDVNKDSYSPDYTTNHITVTPSFFFGNEDYSSKITADKISYYINDSNTAVAKYGSADAIPGDCGQQGILLTIKQNIGVGTLSGSVLKIKAVIAADAIEDEKTKLKNSEIVATIEFARVDSGIDGGAGISVTKVETQYALTQNSIEAPSETDSAWKSTPDAWASGYYLWIRTKITYSNNKIEYTIPYCDSSWKAAADGVLSLSERIDGVDNLIEALQNEVDGAIETWYMKGDPNKLTNYPWYDASLTTQDTEAEHEGDLYFDTDSGKSYRFFKQENGTYKWQIITDSELTQAMQDIQNLQTEVDGKVAIYYNATEPDVNSVHIDDLWIKPDGNFYQCVGTKNADGTESNKKWEVANITIDTVTIEYAEHSSNTSAPTSGWGTSAPAWSPDKYVWQRTVTTFKDDAKTAVISDPVCISAAAARGITISGEQVFKSTDGTSYLPSSITLTAIPTGGLNAGKWYYKNGTSWVDTGVTGVSFSINASHAAFNGGTTATIKVVSSESENYYDVISLYKVADGQKGADGKSTSSVFLTNENITFSADKDGKVTGQTITCNVVAYTGTEKVTPVVGDVTGQVTGMTVAKDGAANNEISIKITIANNATLGGSGAQSGSLSVPISSPVNTTLTISWSKVNTGLTGSAGADAIFAIVESTSGKVVFTDDNSGNIELKASLYKGGSIQESDVAYSWTSIPTGITGSGRTLTVSRSDVPSARSFICTISYDGKSYVDTIALSDKTDAVYCQIESSAGTTFTNGVIETNLKCRVFNGYGEVDAGGTEYTYTWKKYTSTGTATNFYDGSTEKIGKILSIDSDDVDGKSVFSCVITK